MVLMHDSVGPHSTVFIFRVVTSVVGLFSLFMIEHFAIKLSRRALDSSKLPSASIFVNIIRRDHILGVCNSCSVQPDVFSIYSTNSICLALWELPPSPCLLVSRTLFLT